MTEEQIAINTTTDMATTEANIATVPEITFPTSAEPTPATTSHTPAERPAECAAESGFTNWATIAMQGETQMLLTTCSGDIDLLDVHSYRTEEVLAIYEAVYTTDLNVPQHPRIIVIAGASNE
jgi:hypothetical protein